MLKYKEKKKEVEINGEIKFPCALALCQESLVKNVDIEMEKREPHWIALLLQLREKSKDYVEELRRFRIVIRAGLCKPGMQSPNQCPLQRCNSTQLCTLLRVRSLRVRPKTLRIPSLSRIQNRLPGRPSS